MARLEAVWPEHCPPGLALIPLGPRAGLAWTVKCACLVKGGHSDKALSPLAVPSDRRIG